MGNVGYQLLMYATNYCGRGNVKVADIGNGNLVQDYNISEEELILYRRSREGLGFNSSGGLIPGRSSNSSSKADGCSEVQSKSCVGQQDTWYWCHYPKYQCMSKYFDQSDQKYSDIHSTAGKDPWVFVGWLDNGSEKEQTMRYTNSETTTNSYSWSFSSTIEIGMTYSLTLKVPAEMDESQSLSFKWSSTMSTSTTNTKTKTWSIDQPVVVPAETTMKITSVVQKTKVAGQYSSEMSLPAWAKLWCNSKVHGHNEWFVDSAEFLGCGRTNRCVIGGPFKGWDGLSMQTTLKQCKLGTRDC